MLIDLQALARHPTTPVSEAQTTTLAEVSSVGLRQVVVSDPAVRRLATRFRYDWSIGLRC